MFSGEKTRFFWSGLIIFIHSFFLLCQGIWLIIYYPYIYPGVYFVPPGYVPNSNWVFEMIGAIGPSIVGGIVLMIMGLYIMVNREKARVFRLGLIVLGYSFILLLQTIWILFIFPHFYSELYWYVTTNVFINFPRFFEVLGAVVPPMVGSIIFIIVGLQLMKVGVKKESTSNSELKQNLENCFRAKMQYLIIAAASRS